MCSQQQQQQQPTRSDDVVVRAKTSHLRRANFPKPSIIVEEKDALTGSYSEPAPEPVTPLFSSLPCFFKTSDSTVVQGAPIRLIYPPFSTLRLHFSITTLPSVCCCCSFTAACSRENTQSVCTCSSSIVSCTSTTSSGSPAHSSAAGACCCSHTRIHRGGVIHLLFVDGLRPHRRS
jgi:hypothetical protein